jgi:hypothetical protein
MTKDKSIDNELIDNLLKNYKKPEDLIGENGLLKQLTKQLLERAMAAEMTEHVGYEKHDAAGHNSGNSRNGKSAKTIKGTFGELALERLGFDQVCPRFTHEICCLARSKSRRGIRSFSRERPVQSIRRSDPARAIWS